ncbi:MAG: SUF system Fe-S cluster assembly regulator [Coxiellaceae bacterium]|nr:SUF system Fe-S cluster assembly regulator [Coxiellaceae bacterium]|tara:strand:+ start:2778 stop:3251 length:474 start_codon:yes stop_codon:yes gene_type:complete
MLQISKLSDYSVIILAMMGGADVRFHSATMMAERTRLATSTVSKCLKLLCAARLVISERGSKGGYRLARPLTDIRLLDVIRAIEGDVQLTQCVSVGSDCSLQGRCEFRPNWKVVNEQMVQLLADISLQQMMPPSLSSVEFPMFHQPMLSSCLQGESL